MKKSIIGGFVVNELPKAESKKDAIVKCWDCGSYKKQSAMEIKNNRYYCRSHN
jgi:formylmethanofuran dehydrogenase subunit E